MLNKHIGLLVKLAVLNQNLGKTILITYGVSDLQKIRKFKPQLVAKGKLVFLLDNYTTKGVPRALPPGLKEPGRSATQHHNKNVRYINIIIFTRN